MPAVKDQAIVLRRLDYSETSQVLVFLTRDHGLQRLIGKGIKRGTKKQYAIGIDLLESGHLVFVKSTQGEGRLGTLTEWRQTQSHLGLRDNLQRWYAGQYAAEITTAMVEEADAHPDLFDALMELLAFLAAGNDPQEGLVRYQCALLRTVGLWPDLTRCVACDRPAPEGRAAYFSAQQGGLICRNCQQMSTEIRKVSAAVLTGLREGKWEQITIQSALNLLDFMISHIIGRPTSLSKLSLEG
ncbi:MAG: DNA repair protein RecO [Planctomycetota bacterium]|nr:MAG: DNA repair protein RecO [Planctomycetota bacterium]